DIPPIELHASTQCDIRSVEKAKFLADVGFSQIVLARELNLSQWQEAPIGRLLQGATPVYAKTLISRLFTLCAQAHSAAAALLLF
ncbi:U32 family peptidase, partial [Salmonella enterica subsp. enterica serovar Virginia]|nr:U32 family peptidase [Salmonella enterica subsp. enterica serovar Virginia]